MIKSKKYLVVICFMIIAVIIFLYFLPWKTHSIHDDDLFIYKGYLATNGFIHKINLSIIFNQLRPIRDFMLYVLVQLFRYNFNGYYLFNVIIQSVNTILLAYILDFFFRSIYLSLLFSLVFGLSRFSYYTVTQLFNGGILEGAAMTFFLLFLCSLTKVTTGKDLAPSLQSKGLLLAILYANLSMYTHERYIVLFPFLFLIIIFFPGFKAVTLKRKTMLSLLVLLSPVLNAAIKKYCFSMQFFTGTGNSEIKFSFVNAVNAFKDALLSIVQISQGPEYLSGLPFTSLTTIGKWASLFIASTTLILLAVYSLISLYKLFQRFQNQEPKMIPNRGSSRYHFMFFVFLIPLFVLCLAPAVLQIRMELRWYQAPFVVLILMIAIALNSLLAKQLSIRNILSLVLITAFVGTNYYYVYNGAKNLYYSTSARIGDTFDNAIKDSSIHLGKTRLYIWEKQRVPDRESEINWALVSGYFFKRYQDTAMQIIFVDSLYSKADASSQYECSFPDFNKNTDQIVFLDIKNDDQTFKYTITNITNEYLKDSLKGVNLLME